MTLVETGLETMTGGRLKRVARYLDRDEPFCMTYGDGVGDIDIAKLVDFHRSHGKKATVTAATAPGRFGALRMTGISVDGFQEKPVGDGAWINGGFFVLSPAVLELMAVIRLCGRETRWSVWLLMVNSRHTSIMVSGSRWTHCGKRITWRRCGKTERRRGKCGNEKGTDYGYYGTGRLLSGGVSP